MTKKSCRWEKQKNGNYHGWGPHDERCLILTSKKKGGGYVLVCPQQLGERTPHYSKLNKAKEGGCRVMRYGTTVGGTIAQWALIGIAAVGTYSYLKHT